MKRPRIPIAAAIAVCLAWAAVEARHLGREQPQTAWEAAPAPDPAAVESSFADLLRERASGRRENALLGLRERTERGPHRGYAWFLLGELAFEDGAYTAAVGHYRRAVEAEPPVGDRVSAFSSARAIDRRLDSLLQGPWRREHPPEIRDLYYLKRRLAGGCE